jgi:hypothetical protein
MLLVVDLNRPVGFSPRVERLNYPWPAIRDQTRPNYNNVIYVNFSTAGTHTSAHSAAGRRDRFESRGLRPNANFYAHTGEKGVTLDSLKCGLV